MDRRQFLRRGVLGGGLMAAGAAAGAGATLAAEDYRVDIHISASGHAVGAQRPAGVQGTSIVYRVPTDEPIVALTFDDGPSTKYTQRILDILSDSGTVATFFEIGLHVQRLPWLSRQVAADHQIGNHTWSHPDLSLAGAGTATRELARGAAEIAQVTGQPPTVFRPPYGYFSGATAMVAAGMHYPMILWDNRFDVTEDVSTNVDRLARSIRPGSIVLGHDGGTLDNAVVPAALPLLIDRLRSQGLKFVTVSHLLAHAAGGSAAPAQA
ncbi:MAG: polysaccharide deacetylase family protein [Actinobacteria bacterium]|nr:polysaccharide deacetylase family protein [Actinomycetota bacterium]